MSTIIAILTTISTVCGALVTIIGFLTLILKKPKKWIQNITQEECAKKYKELKCYVNQRDEEIREDFLEEIQEIKSGVKDIKKQLNEQDKTDIATLRHEITTIYLTYKDQKKIPSHIKQDWLSLYERYVQGGGNSYIKTITETMENEWTEE